MRTIKEQIKQEIEELDDDIVCAIIDSCKELYCDGIPLFNWDRETMMQRLDKVMKDWDC